MLSCCMDPKYEEPLSLAARRSKRSENAFSRVSVSDDKVPNQDIWKMAHHEPTVIQMKRRKCDWSATRWNPQRKRKKFVLKTTKSVGF